MHTKALKQLAEAGLKIIARKAESNGDERSPEGVGMGRPSAEESILGHSSPVGRLKDQGPPPLKKAEIPDREFDAQELVRGMDTELEHTDDLEVAKAIAKAHLMERPDYYRLLEQMEQEPSKEKNHVYLTDDSKGTDSSRPTAPDLRIHRGPDRARGKKASKEDED